jgi:hypothetical protein
MSRAKLDLDAFCSRRLARPSRPRGFKPGAKLDMGTLTLESRQSSGHAPMFASQSRPTMPGKPGGWGPLVRRGWDNVISGEFQSDLLSVSALPEMVARIINSCGCAALPVRCQNHPKYLRPGEPRGKGEHQDEAARMVAAISVGPRDEGRNHDSQGLLGENHSKRQKIPKASKNHNVFGRPPRRWSLHPSYIQKEVHTINLPSSTSSQLPSFTAKARGFSSRTRARLAGRSWWKEACGTSGGRCY